MEDYYRFLVLSRLLQFSTLDRKQTVLKKRFGFVVTLQLHYNKIIGVI